MVPFYWWGSTASRLEPFRRSNLLFVTKFPWYDRMSVSFTTKFLKTDIHKCSGRDHPPTHHPRWGNIWAASLPWTGFFFFFQKQRSFDSTPPTHQPKKIHGRNQKDLEKQNLNMRVKMSNWLTIRNKYILLSTSLCLLHKQSFRAVLWNRCFFNIW